jgi:hypothetical protein
MCEFNLPQTQSPQTCLLLLAVGTMAEQDPERVQADQGFWSLDYPQRRADQVVQARIHPI